MPTRRTAMAMLAVGLVTGPSGLVRRARAAADERATTFVQATGERLAAIANGPGSAPDKRPRYLELVDAAVDVDGTARFCLGRFWQAASAEQQAQYIAQFREFLVTKIVSHLGRSPGIRIATGAARPGEGTEIVSTTVDRPSTAPAQIDWVVSTDSEKPRVVDLLFAGVSLRRTQHGDYTAYLARNNLDALIAAMRRMNQQSM